MKKILICLVSLSFIGFLQVSTTLLAQEEMDGTPSPSELRQVVNAVEVEPFKVFRGSVNYATNGVALRKRAQGVIHLRGVPAKAKRLRAFIWWTIQTNDAIGDPPSSSIYFNGERFGGNNICSDTDPCWAMASLSAYRADVTRMVPVREPNGDYLVTVRTPTVSNTKGEDPWVSSSSEVPKLEGATLVVVYKDDNLPMRWVAIYDLGVCATNITAAATYTAALLHPAAVGSSATFTMWGADGQRGSSHSDVSSRETTTFNGTQIAGAGAPAPRTTNSDFDGSDGWPLNQLWDTHTHNVSFLIGASPSIVTYGIPSDCVTPIGFALSSD